LIQPGLEPNIEGAMKKVRKNKTSTQDEKRPSRFDRELFFFGENRLALWQPVLYFNPHSAFSSTGDLLILRILEGIECAPMEQQPNLSLNQASMAQIAERYAGQLASSLGLQMKFQLVAPVVARYLLRCSVQLISDENQARPLNDFLRFIGPEPVEDPFEKIQDSPAGDVLNIDLLLRDPYFAHWMINPHDVEKYLEQVKQLEKGPIILTGGPLMAKQQELKEESLRQIFAAKQRSIWAFAFRKAAFYLRDTNSVVSSVAMFYAKQLDDLNLSVENLDVSRALFEKALAIAQSQLKAKQEEEQKSSLIVTPDQLRSR
jgi:hypothetical protein